MSRGLGVLVLPALSGGVAIGILLSDLGGRDLIPAELLGFGFFALLAAVVERGGPRIPGWLLRATALAAVLLLGTALGTFRASETALPTGAGTVSALAGSKDELSIRGTVIDDPRPREDRQQVVLENVAAGGRPVPGRILAWLPRSVEVATGDRVVFRARLEEPRDFDGFAYRAFLARQGIGAIARTFDATVVNHQAPGLAGGAARLRALLVDGLDTIVPEPEAALGAGILLGVRSSIDPAVNAAFATAGLTHVVAISGWNIAIVGALVVRLLDGLRRRVAGRLLVEPFTALAIGGYVVLVGSSPSVIRAALMAGALMLGRQAGSRAHAASALMLAALAMMVVAPPVVWDVGFQLSLLATAGLIAFGAPIERRLHRWPCWLREPVALTLAAQLTTMPVILATFERVSLVAPLANVLVVPLVPLVMLACAVAAVVGVLGAALPIPILTDATAWFAGGSAWLGLRLMILAGSSAAALPLAALPIAAPGWLAVAWYPTLALLWRRANREPSNERPGDELTPLATVRRPSAGRLAVASLVAYLGRLIGTLARPGRALLVITAGLGVTTLATLPDGRLHLIVMDVGQGDGILVVTPTGRSMLVDAGPDPDQTLRQLGTRLPWWQRTIDVIILTHPHQDHVGGFPEVLRRFRVSSILDAGRPYQNPTYDRFLELSRAEPGASYRLARAGQRLALDPGTSFQIWYPSVADAAGPLLEADINNASVVGLLQFGRFTALLTGDAKAPVEKLVEARSLVGRVDVLKVGHHGSSSGTTPGFLAALHPAAGLISVGAGNRYGHPAPVTIRALRAAYVEVLRTDRDGTIDVQTDGASWKVSARGRVVVAGMAQGASSAAAQTVPAQYASEGSSSGTRASPAGSIPAWPYRMQRRLVGSWRRAGCRRASWSTRKASRASRGRRPAGWKPRGSRSTWASSRPPPFSTTSTSWRRGRAGASTGWPEPRCSKRWASVSWDRPSQAIRSVHCWTTAASRGGGRRSW
jgi:competence protein ComEC